MLRPLRQPVDVIAALESRGNFGVSNCLKENLGLQRFAERFLRLVMLVAAALIKFVRALANYIRAHRHALAAMFARPIFGRGQQPRARPQAALPFGHDQPVHFRADLNLQQWLLAHMHPADHSILRSICHEYGMQREAGLIPSSLLRISAAVAGYPSSPASTAIRGASAPFARRIFSSLSSPMGVIFSGRFPLKPCLHGGTLQFAQRVRRNPAGGARSLPADSFRGADGFPVEPFISFPDVSQGPV